ncbi:hypothetical protein M426DRAFT_7535 [Hypoxylon sp. CI-4A]|nr:hypothetical protein M426DRAFT_7535 [Hypoxylon sp. CI-4A]
MASSVDAKLLRATKFPPEFNQKVDMQKVNLQVMKKWIASKISEILGSEDDVVTELCFNLIEGPRYPDIKSMQIQLTGFLDKDTAPFCKDLWNLCLSAQASPQGVPKELLEAKKMELIQEKVFHQYMLLKRRKSDEKPRNVASAKFQIFEIENVETAVSVAAATIGAVADAVAIELSAVVAEEALVVAVTDHFRPQGEKEIRIEATVTVMFHKIVAGADKKLDVDVPHRDLRVLRELRYPVLDRPARPVTVAAAQVFDDHPPHHATALEDVDHRLVIEMQPRETDPQDGEGTIDPVETIAEEAPLQTAPVDQAVVDLVRHHPSGEGTRTRLAAQGLLRAKIADDSVVPRRRQFRDHAVVAAVLEEGLPSASDSPEDKRRPREKSRPRRREDSKARDVPSRKRRNSANSPRARDRSADGSEDEERPKSPRHRAAVEADETKTPQQRANELRERLLKERIKKMRGTSSRDNVKG